MGADKEYNIGALFKSEIGNVPVADDGAAALEGDAIDRMGHYSCKLSLMAGAATGTPTAQTADCKLQESADGATGWADITGASVTQIDGDNEVEEVDVNLRTAERYIRAVTTVALTGGTTPTWPVASLVSLGGSDVLPTA